LLKSPGESRPSISISAVAAGLALFVVGLLVFGCATSPLGRKQLKLLPSDEVNRAGGRAFHEILAQKPQTADVLATARVRCVTAFLARGIPGPAGELDWHVVVFEASEPNAFALPGGRIGVNRGMLDVATTPDQLAAVLGHEMAHVQADHANERMSANLAATGAVTLLSIAAARADLSARHAANLLGAGAQLGILFPYSRAHEREADLLGLDLMARVGFAPDAAVLLWQRMSAARKSTPPEFLSTHPASESRIAELRQRLPHARFLYRDARAAGHRPVCE